MNDYLYIIVPYFNFCQWKSNINNLDLFLSKNKFSKNVRIVISEGIFNSELKDYSDRVFLHLKFNFKNVFWIKENLINLAISRLPKDWKYVIWCDRDVVFDGEQWIDKSIEKLSQCDVIQPWNKLNYLDKNGNKLNAIYYSTLYTKSGVLEKNIHGHSGMAWGINNVFYKKIKKILDWQIVGGADITLGFSFGIKDHKKLLKLMQTKAMKKTFKKYLKNFKDIKYDYVEANIKHLWHGDLENRSYSQRYKILEKHNFDPSKDIYYNNDGVIELSESKIDLEKDIINFFMSRKEDD
jgi:hypothetical protein